MMSINKAQFYQRLASIKKIAAIKEPKYLEKALEAELSAVVLSIGNIAVIKRYVDLFKRSNFPVFLHIERIGGISHDKDGVDFIAHYVKPVGIVSTRNNLIIQAKKQGLLTIQRLFLVDSDAVKSGLQSIQETQPDAVEFMPALVTDYIAEFRKEIDLPIIAGGLIRTKDQMREAIRHGATAVSMGNCQLWKEDLNYE
ncbi:glycerol-3-phosphate responsive antiterminator [Thermanaerosceptrum fracticalcis]|uniref:glycerol-3-phosphate responsive antiterminator n=1 Tax=Thermanaerosceptrum fracticalcis TaxID=1712410 RepID=UPI000AF8FF30|nr:glycerol-3-phosphate responsive antiterminator [Thermanaerosceptrum fracticalcis]